jgi:aldehyde dehydrogenase (NAD+)
MRRSRRRARRSTAVEQLSARERGRLVRKLGERLMARADDVARLETPATTASRISRIAEDRDPAGRPECFEYYGGWSDKVMGENDPGQGQLPHRTRCAEPLRWWRRIVPWNFPLLLACSGSSRLRWPCGNVGDS